MSTTQGHALVYERRCRVSVCLATFNGARFLRAQIESILVQLSARDELVVVDDSSGDKTLEIIGAYRDPRIIVLTSDSNHGPTSAFERAITFASGDFIFLCDQDDIWAPDKVSTSVERLGRAGVLALVSDALVIDGEGNTLIESYQKWRGSAEGFWRNLRKNGFLGCCMAFRGSSKKFLLPFPTGINMHDEWIGLCCSVAGRTEFIADRLISYRRHGANVTGMSRGSLAFMLGKRIVFLVAIVMRLPRLLGFRWSA